MSAVAIIPARGGSRRVPLKNVRPFFGRPVLSYSILAAAKSGLFDAIYVSTDDLDIALTAKQYGARVLTRSEEMARDEVGTQEVTRDALQHFHAGALPDYACCIYPCAPTLLGEDLLKADDRLRSVPCIYAMVTGMFYLGATKAFLDGVPLEGNSVELPWNERHIDINESDDFDRAAAVYLRMMTKGEV